MEKHLLMLPGGFNHQTHTVHIRIIGQSMLAFKWLIFRSLCSVTHPQSWSHVCTPEKVLQEVEHWLTYSYSSRQWLVTALLSTVAIPRLGLHCLSQPPSSQKPKHSHPAEALPCLFFIPESSLITPRMTCQPSPSLAMLKFMCAVF